MNSSLREQLATIVAVLFYFCLAAQAWLILTVLLGSIPLANPLAKSVVPEWQYMVRPERESYLFHVFVALGVLGWGLSLKWKLKITPVRLGFEALSLIVLMMCAFKIAVLPARNQLAKECFWIIAAIGTLMRIFWSHTLTWTKKMKDSLWNIQWNQPQWTAWAAVGLVLLLFVPDAQDVLARMFVGEQYHHFDSFMAPIWAHTSGCVLNMDIMTEYGIGLPIFAEHIAKIFGGVSYPHIFYVWLWMAIVYFVFMLIFVRMWLGSMALALISVLIAIKWQMFHPGVTPFVFTFPSATVARYWFDLPILFFIFLHVRQGNNIWAAWAGILTGYLVFYMPTIGYCAALSFYAYIFGCVILPQMRRSCFPNTIQWTWLAVWIVSVPAIMNLCMYLTQGPAMFTPEFKANMGEFNNYFLSGFGLMPMHESLQNREVLASFMGFCIPGVYVFTLIFLMSRLIFSKGEKTLMLPAVICLYGLLMYHYYIARSAVTSYYVVCIPFVLILAFWCSQMLPLFSIQWRKRIYLTLFGLLVIAFASNHNYLNYPNLFNVSRNPIVDQRLVQPLSDGRSYFNQLFSRIPDNEKLPVNNLGETNEDLRFEQNFKTDQELKSYYIQESDFSKDVALITLLTSKDERVPLMSSFEIAMLMAANRKPFFYYSPILIARPMRMRTFPNSTMYTFTHAKRMIQDLEHRRPEHIFMEKVFLQTGFDQLYKDPGLLAMVHYINQHYTQQSQGQYLVAMQLKK